MNAGKYVKISRIMLRRVLAPRRESQANSVEAPVTYKIPQRTAKPSPGKENMIEDISSPVNLQRQLHVSYDESTGNYRVRVLKNDGLLPLLRE